MSKHRHPEFVGTAKVAINLFPEILFTLDELMATPVGALIRDSDGDLFERRPHGIWRCDRLPQALTDEHLLQYGPFAVENHAELTALELDGYRLGHLVRVLTNDYAVAVGKGENGVIERIEAGHLWLRFTGGQVVPLLPAEVEPVHTNNIRMNAYVDVTRDVFPHAPLGKGAVGIVIGRVPGCIEPTWIVRIVGESPWFGEFAAWQYPESALVLAEDVFKP